MKNIYFIILLISPYLSFSQTYTHGTVGQQNTYLANCMVNTCSGTYYDDGDVGGDYSTSYQTYRTFCPDVEGQCVRMTVNSINVESAYSMMGVFLGCYDEFYFLNSATQTNFAGPFCSGNLGAGSIATSTDRSGCLGVFFSSDVSVAQAGWDISISCVPCAQDSVNNGNDCVQNQGVCADTPISSVSNGPGEESTCVDCLVSENYSSWYQILVQTAGNFEFTISPTNGTDDYDFALFQANDCSSLGTPVRCSYAAGVGATGMSSGCTGTSEDVNGDGCLDDINSVSVGDEFFLMVNDWSGTGGGYTLSWTGSSSLNCSVLPVELLNFEGRSYDNFIELNWNVAVELSLDRYEVEKMIKGEWVKILEKAPAGNNTFYAITDYKPLRGNNQYRLKSIDVNGEYKYHDPINVVYNKDVFDIRISADQVSILSTDIDIEKIEMFNMLGQEVLDFDLHEVIEKESYVLDLNSLVNNTYVIRVNGIQSKLFVKY
jgi:hypothetical protein